MEEVKEVSVIKEAELLEENSTFKEELNSLRQELSEIKSLLSSHIPSNSTHSQTNACGFQTNPINLPSKTSSFPLFSTGNGGVPTDRQTDRQKILEPVLQPTIQPALEAINSLKSELKIKFRNLTKQEFKVFSAIYILEQQQSVDYKTISEKLKLSEGSIRDYVMKLERKGIPIHKEKVNNKKILLHIRQELRELVPLEAIMNFREPLFKQADISSY